MLLNGFELFFLGDWHVNPNTNSLRRGELINQLEPKAMDVLLLLCKQQGEVLSADEIATQCWGGIDIGDNPVHKAITQLRKALGDKASAPTYIETIRKRGYRIIAKLDFPLNEELKAERKNWQGTSPFPGLVPFEAKDAQVFFGRNEQIATLLDSIASQVSAKHAFCLILGPSGTGKSSLVNAGLLPALCSHNGYNGVTVVSHTNIDFADVSQERLFIDVASAMLDWDVNNEPVFSGMSANELAAQLQSDVEELIQTCSQALQANQQGYNKTQFLLFIDRLEVLLSSPIFSNDEREAFIALIETLATSGVIIVLSACRNDFYPLVVNYSSLMTNKGNGGHFDLMAPTRAELMQMICLPAIAANLTWSVNTNSAASLEQLLCDEAANNPDALPMLQYTLQELYLQRSENDALQVSVYHELGGIEGAIGKKAEEIYQSAPLEHQEQLHYLLSLLVTLSPDGKSITSRAARWAQLTQASQKAFVQTLVESRLFVSHLKNGEPCFSLAHEALLRRWPRASNWIVTHRNSLEIKSRLQHLSAQWLAEYKSPAYLLVEGKPLQEAQTLQDNAVFKLDEQEQALINASMQKVKVKRRLKGAIMGLLCLLTFVAVLMSYQSQQAQTLAQQKQLEAESLLGFMVGEFADKLRGVKRMDLLDGISNKALEYFSQQDAEAAPSSFWFFADTEQNFKSQFQHAQTLGAMGEVAYSRSKNDEAEQAFVAAKTILDKLYEQQPENMDLLKTLGANVFWLAQLRIDNANFLQAKPFFELYLQYGQAMVNQSPEDIDAQWELSYAYIGMGSVDTKLQSHSVAKIAFEKALNIQQKIVIKLPAQDISHLYIADTLEWLAESEEQLGGLKEAIQSRENAQNIVKNLLITHSGNANLLEYLAYSYFNTANVQYYLSDYNAANQSILRAISHFDSMLGQDSSNKVWQLQLIAAQALQRYLAQNIHGQVLVSQLNLDDFNRVLNVAEQSPFAIAIFIKSYQSGKQWELSRKAIDLAIPKMEDLVSQQPSNEILLLSLSNIYLASAKQAQDSQSDDSDITKLKYCQKVVNILRPSIDINSSFELLLPYVQAHYCLGELSSVNKFVQKLENIQITKVQL